MLSDEDRIVVEARVTDALWTRLSRRLNVLGTTFGALALLLVVLAWCGVDQTVENRVQKELRRKEGTIDSQLRKLVFRTVQLEHKRLEIEGEIKGLEVKKAELAVSLDELEERKERLTVTSDEVTRLLDETTVVLALKKTEYDLTHISTLELRTSVRFKAGYARFAEEVEFPFVSLTGEGMMEPIAHLKQVSREIRNSNVLAFKHALTWRSERDLVTARISTLENVSRVNFASIVRRDEYKGDMKKKHDQMKKAWGSIEEIEFYVVLNDVPLAPVSYPAPKLGDASLEESAIALILPVGDESHFPRIGKLYEKTIEEGVDALREELEAE